MPAETTTSDALVQGLATLGMDADTAQIERLRVWLQLLERWNTAFNLTAIAPAQRIVQLVLMSAAAIPHLKAGDILDVGSGAGVPGIPLAILAPGNGYTLLDSNGKKTRFLEQCRIELGLDNVRVVRARAEEFKDGTFATIVSRAFARLDTFFSATRHLGGADTDWLAFKGPAAVNEVQHLPPDRAKWRFHRLQIPGLDRSALLVVVQQQETNG